MRLQRILYEYLKNSTLHGARFIVDEDASRIEKFFWLICVLVSWFASWLLISASLEAFENNAISFVAETSYKDWETNFPAVVVCELKNMDRIQEIAEDLWGYEHDFTLEEVLSEIAFFRGESYHTVHECGENEMAENCFTSNFSYYAKLVRSSCEKTISSCKWNGSPFDCCKYFVKLETELGICYAINSLQTSSPDKMSMYSNRVTGPGSLIMDVLTEANIYVLGEEEVPNLVTPKTEILTVGPYVSYLRFISKKDIQNDEQTRSTSVQQRNCRFNDENILNVHKYYSYSACIVQCRKDKQFRLCNCTSHLMPNTPEWLYCNMTGLQCLNEYYEDLSVVIAKWSYGRKGLVCDCLPSCSEVDISTVLDSKENIYGHQNPISKVQISLMELPTERYKRIVVRGKLDLVVSMGGTTGLFVGASLLSFVEIFYYFTVRAYNTFVTERTK
ncbi:sodium channel protein Nach isoform X3 [Episyrphus balteatus]|uniref:sodium channel protein Nach isoform X3 n=1 Tax=Episyrphus balteatus TaxID=286459 RepID=UPI002485C4F6|nr:sodium channel protein Nach isoform X3 [Episyrphus balteatus]